MRLAGLLVAVSLVFATACGDGGQEQPKDAPPIDAPSAGPDADCFNIEGKADPTHEEIINACTTAIKLYKPNKPPLLNPDGSLPPLPQ
jgi:hypothetical protein